MKFDAEQGTMSIGCRVQGFSFIELMVVIGIVSVLAGIAAPNLQGWVNDNRIEAAAVQVRGVLNAARSRSISGGRMSRVEFPEGALTACTISDSTKRCADTDADDRFLSADTGGSTLQMGSNGAIDDGVMFDSKGRIFPRRDRMVFTFCDSRGPAKGLMLSLNQIGRTTTRPLSSATDGRCL